MKKKEGFLMDGNEKLYDLIEKMYREFTVKFEAIDARFDAMNSEFSGKFDAMDKRFQSLETKLDTMNDDIKDLKTGQKRIEDKLDDIEAQNASRHVALATDIKEIKYTQSKMEIVTADNWKDIATLKAKKLRKMK